MITDVIIMAGGFGERLWPASSPENPKQFMALNEDISFLQNSLIRALALNPVGKILVITRRDIETQCANQCKMLADRLDGKDRDKLLSDACVLSEPYGRHTSAAIMTGICYLKKLNPSIKHTILVQTSDHVIEPVGTFTKDCMQAAKAAEDGKFVCFAIPPIEPSTAYGYIKTGTDLYNDGNIFAIENFKEKPSLEVAKAYLEDGSYWWNSGMFTFDADIFLLEMQNCTPEVSNSFVSMFESEIPDVTKINSIDTVDKWVQLEEVYKTVPNIAVDKAIAEKTKNAAAIKAHFNWTDVGSWDTFSSLCTNPVNNETTLIQSDNNFIYSDLPVALCGVDNLIVVVKNGKVLVMKKGESALVREAVDAMKRN